MQRTRGVGAMRRGLATRARHCAVFAVLCAQVGCAHYTPRPFVPEQSLRSLESRSLTDPELLRHIRERTGKNAVGVRQRPSSEPRWDRAELFLAAMELNPGLAEARAQLGQAAASVTTARAIQNPVLSLATEYDLSRAAESP